MSSKKTTLKAGLIGFGYWGPILLRNITANPDLEPVMIADLNRDKAEKALELAPSSHITLEAMDVIEDPGIDVVFICTQASSHGELTRKALENEKHVFVEKPAALSSSETAELLALGESVRRTVMVDHTFLFTPQYECVKELVTTDTVGDLYRYHSTRADFGLFQTDANVIWHLLYHDAYLILDLFDTVRPVSVKADGASHIVPGVEDTVVASIKFESRLQTHIVCDMLFPVKKRDIVISGSEGIILWDDTVSERVRIFRKRASYDEKSARVSYSLADSVEVPDHGDEEALKRVMAHFVHCVRTGEPPRSDLASALRVARLLEAVAAAGRDKGREIKI